MTRWQAAVGALLLAGLALTPSAAAAPGDLDPTFSGNGWVRTYELGGTPPYFAHGAEDMALQPDGKILATGELEGGGSYSAFGVLRYTADGRLDRSFGRGGWAATELGTFEGAHAVALQRDGKIVVGGEVECDIALCFGLVRYLPNGALDSSFGDRGVVRTRIVGGHWLALAIRPDGRIVAAGRSYNRYGQIFAAARYLPDGRLDRTFSRDGLATIAFGNSYEGAEGLALQRDGKILIAGGGGRYQDFAIARFRANGRLDRTFSNDGRVTVGFGRGRWDIAHALALRRDGRIVVAGESRAGQIGPARIALTRLTRRGALDRSFGTRGRRLTSPGPFGGYANALLALPDGRLVVAGLAYGSHDSLDSNWTLARFTAAGTLDRSFGGDGIVVSSFGTGADWVGALARQPDGKIVAAGEVYIDQAIARYLSR